MMVQMPIMIHQSGLIRPTHKREHTAAITADIECTLFSRSEDKKAGAVPTNAMAAGARNARNWKALPSDIEIQAGIIKATTRYIMIGNRNPALHLFFQ